MIYFRVTNFDMKIILAKKVCNKKFSRNKIKIILT